VIALLAKIWCVISHIDCYLLYAGKAVVNAIVIALATAAQFAINAIPVNVPDSPSMPAPVTTALGWIAWVIPVGTIFSILAFALTAWVAWQVAVIILRWVKASGE
jgi:hypothetical protein